MQEASLEAAIGCAPELHGDSCPGSDFSRSVRDDHALKAYLGRRMLAKAQSPQAEATVEAFHLRVVDSPENER